MKLFEQATVFVIDDDQQARESVCALVQSMSLRSRAFASAEEFLEHIDRDVRGCVVTDLRMLGMNGLELQDTMRARGIIIPVILITAYPRTSLTVRAMKQGAVTLLEKPYEEDDLWDAVREALRMSELQYDKQTRRRDILQRLELLTPKEQQVMELMIEGVANKVIAKRLDVSIRTVENRRHDIFEKMHARSLAELVRMVVSTRDDQAAQEF
jgi:FixJ family two-component response regulator